MKPTLLRLKGVANKSSRVGELVRQDGSRMRDKEGHWRLALN